MNRPSQLSNETKWIVSRPNPDSVERLRTALNLPWPVALALVNRGLEGPEAVASFLAPSLKNLNDPLLLRDMDLAIGRTMEAMDRGETICVHGDYDADGMTSTALLASFFDQAGYPVRTFLPDRMTDGYGLNQERLRELAGEGVKLIIAVDCGTRAVDEAALLNSLGCDLVILDHHAPGPSLPDACAVVNPHREDCPFPFKGLAAVGVAFYFAGALRRALSEAGRIKRDSIDVRLLLDLVAVGTITDAVPLREDNRAFVSVGTRLLTEGPRLGLSALKAVAGIRNRPVTPGVVAFQLGPRLNAIGRLGNPGIGLDLLLARDPEEATRYADVLDRENQARREVEARVQTQAFQQVEDQEGVLHKVVVVWGEGWHPGVVGIVASRLVEAYRRPAVVIGVSDEVGRGSCRSIKGFDIGAALTQLSDFLVRYGGHPMAAGVTIEAGRIGDFAAALYDLADAGISDEELVPALRIDGELPFGAIDLDLVTRLSELQPYGIGNPEPVFCTSGVTIEKARRVGRDGQHLQFTLRHDDMRIPAIWWSGGSVEGMEAGGRLDVAFNAFVDDRTGLPRLRIKNVRPFSGMDESG